MVQSMDILFLYGGYVEMVGEFGVRVLCGAVKVQIIFKK